MAIASGVYGAADVRGRIGGAIFSNWRGTQTIRKYTKPVRRWQTTQPFIRSVVGYLARKWGYLTAGERAGWEQWADEHPRTNSLGDSFTLTGEQMYISLNSPLIKLFAKDADSDTAPVANTDQTLINFTATQMAAPEGRIELDWELPNAGDAGDKIQIHMGGPYFSPARTAVPPEMQFRFAGVGDTVTRIVEGLTAGAWYWFAARYLVVDGQTSAWQVAQATPSLAA